MDLALQLHRVERHCCRRRLHGGGGAAAAPVVGGGGGGGTVGVALGRGSAVGEGTGVSTGCGGGAGSVGAPSGHRRNRPGVPGRRVRRNHRRTGHARSSASACVIASPDRTENVGGFTVAGAHRRRSSRRGRRRSGHRRRDIRPPGGRPESWRSPGHGVAVSFGLVFNEIWAGIGDVHAKGPAAVSRAMNRTASRCLLRRETFPITRRSPPTSATEGFVVDAAFHGKYNTGRD